LKGKECSDQPKKIEDAELLNKNSAQTLEELTEELTNIKCW